MLTTSIDAMGRHWPALSYWVKHCGEERLVSLQWRHNGRNSASNHQPHDCLLKRLFRRGSKKTSKPRVTGLCEGYSPGTGEFPAQMASNAENVSIWWLHHVFSVYDWPKFCPRDICSAYSHVSVHCTASQAAYKNENRLDLCTDLKTKTCHLMRCLIKLVCTYETKIKSATLY